MFAVAANQTSAPYGITCNGDSGGPFSPDRYRLETGRVVKGGLQGGTHPDECGCSKLTTISRTDVTRQPTPPEF